MLDIKGLSKVYPTPRGPYVVMEDFHLQLKQGEVAALIGHSGCGKSTVLNMVAGLVPSSGGSILLDGKEVKGPGTDRAVVFQSPSLFPWMSALENVMLGVRQVFSMKYRFEQEEIASSYLDRVGLGKYLHCKAADMSQGMRQRVGIARALALEPRLLLLDEPFGMLDSLTRTELHAVLLECLAKTHTTAILVTHDVDEAVLLGDRVVMMTSGPFAKVGQELRIDLERPRNAEQLKESEEFYRLRQTLLDFLDSGEAHKPHRNGKEEILSPVWWSYLLPEGRLAPARWYPKERIAEDSL